MIRIYIYNYHLKKYVIQDIKPFRGIIKKNIVSNI